MTVWKASAPAAGSWLSRLDVEETPVGGEADAREGGQVGQPFADADVAGSLTVVSVRRALPSFWYCVILAFL